MNGAHRTRLAEINYRIRTWAFGYSFFVIALTLLERGSGPLGWILLALQFLAYPHLAWLRASNATDPRRAELGNLLVDAALLGAWAGALGFPTWIAYGFLFSTGLNNAVNRGWIGAARSVGCFFLGALAGWAFAGASHWPETSPLVTTLCFGGALAYTVGVGVVVWRQNRRVRASAEALRESEERYRLIAENAGDLIAMTDRDGRWLYTSPSYAGLLSGEDLEPGADAFRRVHEEDQFRVRAAVQVVARSGEHCRLRMRLLAVSGTERLLDALARPVRGRGGQIEGVVLASRDVTELWQRERQLEVAAHTFERMAEAMVIASADGRILTVNREFSRITGFPSREVVGRPEREFRSAMQPPSFWDEVYAEVERTGHWTGTTWSQRRNGTLYREWRSVSAVRDDEQRITHYVTLFRELNGGQALAQSA